MLLVVTLYRVPSTPSLFLQTETYRNNVLDSLRFLKTGSELKHCIHSLYSSVFVMALNRAVS